MYVAKMPFGYDGKTLITNEVIEKLTGLRNDKILLDLNYFVKLTAAERKQVRKCDGCSRTFADESGLYNHRRLHLCGASSDEIMEKSPQKDKDFLANLPDAVRDNITDLK